MSAGCGRHEDSLASFALGACPSPEADQVSAHLDECPSCRAEVGRLRVASAALLTSVPPVSPPPEVKSRVMTQVRADAALMDAARSARADSAPPAGAGVRSWWRSLSERSWGRPGAVAVACGLLLAVAVGTGTYLGLRSESQEPTVLKADVDDGLAPRASGTLELRGEQARLRVRGLPDPGRGRAYQVWVRDAREAPRPANATLQIDARGRGAAAVPAAAGGADQVLVTSEPEGGSQVPTRVPVLKVDI